jgi:uncharacterized protein (UPF0261 family)
MNQLPMGCGLSKIDGRRLESLDQEELMALLDIRVKDVHRLVADHGFRCGQSMFDNFARVVEVLNAGLARGRDFSNPRFVPNHPWRESDV